jgi:zinc D-Ala-D-Ala carboxypeptidase
MSERLTPHFTLAELIRSDAATKLKIGNVPASDHMQNLRTLALGLEWARAILGAPLKVTSGYRNPEVNRAVGGVANSDHALGFAADIVPAGVSVLAAAKKLAASPLVFDQLIHESGRGIIHLSFAPRMRRQVLTQKGGPGTPVTKGLDG